MHKTGVLLLNLGTPASSKTADVRAYLNEFLFDPRVIELPTLLRWLLVKCCIVPLRAKKSAAAYAKIWQPEGSPLLINSVAIKKELAQVLGEDYVVTLGMRYGNPSIASALQDLQHTPLHKIIVLPLFPQYSSAATGSALQQLLSIVKKYKVVPQLQIIQNFFQDQHYIKALAQSIVPYVSQDFDYLLMSYHGLPQQQMQHAAQHNCDLQAACPAISAANINCYRAQCYQTSRLLAQQLNLPAEKWGIGFQSRLGRLQWIEPYTDHVLQDLRQRGVSKLVVCCPSFVADCLETLEEIGIRAREQWLELGGSELQLVPCLNDSASWISALKTMVYT